MSNVDLPRLEALLAGAAKDRKALYDAMREVCRIVGGMTNDGVSVDFLLHVPAEVEAKLAEAQRDGERLSHIIEQSNLGNGWLTDAVWDDAAELCPMVWEEAEDVQKWVRAVIDKDIAARKEGV